MIFVGVAGLQVSSGFAIYTVCVCCVCVVIFCHIVNFSLEVCICVFQMMSAGHSQDSLVLMQI